MGTLLFISCKVHTAACSGAGGVKSYAQNEFLYLVEIYYRGQLTAPWLRFSGLGRKPA